MNYDGYLGSRRVFSVALGLVLLQNLLSAPSAHGEGVQKAIQMLIPATVAVEWRSEPDATKWDEAYYRWTGKEIPGQFRVPRSSGTRPDTVGYSSGTVVSADGLIVTAHVPENVAKLTVNLEDGRTLEARVVVDDKRTGLQLLKVNANDLSPVRFADAQPGIGQDVVAVVCTDVNDRVAARGIVAAKNRSINKTFRGLLQTDISVGAMSAGAPLADTDGRLLGVIVARESLDGKQSGASFAVPTRYVKFLVAAREEKGSLVISRGILGVRVEKGEEAPIVTQVIANSAADKAGLSPGDEILELAGIPVTSTEELIGAVADHAAGDEVELKVRREGKVDELHVQLGEYRGPGAPLRAGVIQTVELQKLYVIDAEGKLKVIQLGKNHSLSLGELALIPGGAVASQDKKSQTRASVAWWTAKEYYKLLDQLQSHVGPLPPPATIRVQRSDVEEKLDELTAQVKSLEAHVVKLTEALERVGAKLEKE